jgi:HSP20 family protein
VFSPSRAKRKRKRKRKRNDYYLSERRYGSFERRLQIPEGIDEDKIEATFKNGVLSVTLPKKPEVQKQAKRIDVEVA